MITRISFQTRCYVANSQDRKQMFVPSEWKGTGSTRGQGYARIVHHRETITEMYTEDR